MKDSNPKNRITKKDLKNLKVTAYTNKVHGPFSVAQSYEFHG